MVDVMAPPSAAAPYHRQHHSSLPSAGRVGGVVEGGIAMVGAEVGASGGGLGDFQYATTIDVGIHQHQHSLADVLTQHPPPPPPPPPQLPPPQLPPPPPDGGDKYRSKFRKMKEFHLQNMSRGRFCGGGGGQHLQPHNLEVSGKAAAGMRRNHVLESPATPSMVRIYSQTSLVIDAPVQLSKKYSGCSFRLVTKHS